MQRLEELRGEYSDPNLRQAIGDLYALSCLYRRAVRTEGFQPSEKLCEAISLTEAGQRLYDHLPQSLGPERLKFAVFLIFAHDHLYLDLNKSDVPTIHSCLDEDIKAKTLKFPWIFDHLLYDHAAEWGDQRPDTLTTEQTKKLLSLSPPGVFQLSKVVVGPYGALASTESRSLAPTRELLLWHCADSMCGAVHTGTLQQFDKDVYDACSTAEKQLENKIPPSSWGQFASRIITRDHYYTDYSLVNLPGLLGNAFSESELQEIVRATIDAEPALMRPRIESLGLRGTSRNIVERLSKPELLQILLLAPDRTIVAVLDDLIASQTIVIPAMEVRIAKAVPTVGSFTECSCQCSDMGIRVAGRSNTASPSARLKHLLMLIFSSNQELLAFRLRKVNGATLGQKLEQYIADHGPREIIKELILLTPEIVRAACDHIGAPHLKKFVLEDDEQLTDQLMWKIGFSRRRYSSPIESFYKRLRVFRKTAMENECSTEDARGVIRSAGVNLFVSLEEILDLGLCFSTWLLLSDHVSEKHVFDLSNGRQLLALHLNGIASSDMGPIVYDTSGKNTLFPLIVGFGTLRTYVEQLVPNSEKYKRAPVLLAHYSHKPSPQQYPYRHLHFALDAVPAERAACFELLSAVSNTLQGETVMSVRNRIDHKSDKFPSRDEILKCCDTLERIIGQLEWSGLIPVVYAPETVTWQALSGDPRSLYSNYSGRQVELSRSPNSTAIRSLPDLTLPQILVPSFRLPETNEILRFSLHQESEYSRMWRGYPRRRKPTASDIVSTPPSEGVKEVATTTPESVAMVQEAESNSLELPLGGEEAPTLAE
ncbi:MAG: hypothetical protein ACM3JB_02385 [Acidobacteriaceae bacterium]